MNTNNKNTLKNVWKKPLAALLGLSIMASMSTSCLANEKHEQFAEKMKMKIFTEEDVKGWGWVIASVEASKLGLDEKEFIFEYSKEDLKLIRRLSDFFDTEEKRKQMAWIDNKQKANAVLTEEESLIFENYNEALAELRKMLKQKIKTGAVSSSLEHIEAYETNDEMMDAVSKLYTDRKKRDENKTKTSSADVNADADALYLTHNLRLYHSLDQYTRALLTGVSSWNGNFDLTPEEEKVIKEADAFYSNEENQKLLRSAGKESVKLSKEEEEASRESRKHMTALSRIKDKSSIGGDFIMIEPPIK